MKKNTITELTQKWIETHGAKENTVFVFGNRGCEIVNGEVIELANDVVVFRNEDYINDDLVCRICGTEHENTVEAVRCCMYEE